MSGYRGDGVGYHSCRWLEGKNTVMGGRLSGKKEEVGMGFMNNSGCSQGLYRSDTCRGGG